MKIPPPPSTITGQSFAPESRSDRERRKEVAANNPNPTRTRATHLAPVKMERVIGRGRNIHFQAVR